MNKYEDEMKRKVKLTADRLREMLSYDRDTGVFTWLKAVCNVRVGATAGRINQKNGYRYIRLDGEEFTAQRLAWLHVTGTWPTSVIQFKDKDRTNISFGNIKQGNSLLHASDFDTSTPE